jgi:hypothetical protein
MKQKENPSFNKSNNTKGNNMPNWCNNTIQFESGKPIRDFLSPYLNKMEDGGYEFDFNKIIPVPADLVITSAPGTKDAELQAKYKANTEKHGYANWYDFCIERWGTKWNGSGDFSHDDKAFIFETAWSPSLQITEKLAEQLPNDEMLIHNYIEEGMDFCGKFVAGNLGGADEFYNKISDAPQSLKDELGYEPWEEEELDEDDDLVEDSKP